MKKYNFIIIVTILAMEGFLGGFELTKSLSGKDYADKVLTDTVDISLQGEASAFPIQKPTEHAPKESPTIVTEAPAPIAKADVVTTKPKSSICPSPKKEYEDETDMNVGQEIS